MDPWREPLDEFTLRFLMYRVIEDRERHLRAAKELRKYDESAGESYMVRAEECSRIIKQLKELVGLNSDPPPKKEDHKNRWPM